MPPLSDSVTAELQCRLQIAVTACSERGLWQAAKW